CLLANCFDYPPIDYLSFFRAIEVDQVQTRESSSLKLPGNFHRILAVDFFTCIVALREPDAFTIDKINCRYDIHDRYFLSRSVLACIKLLRTVTPASADFSGWN